MEIIQDIISKHDWILQCWDDRYGRGIWVVIAPQINHTYELREIIDGGSIESTTLADYLHKKGKWLPVTNSEHLTEALAALNSKLKQMNNDTWRTNVYNAFQTILEVNDGSYGLKTAINNKNKSLINLT